MMIAASTGCALRHLCRNSSGVVFMPQQLPQPPHVLQGNTSIYFLSRTKTANMCGCKRRICS
jgi:hypothetical protein